METGLVPGVSSGKARRMEAEVARDHGLCSFWTNVFPAKIFSWIMSNKTYFKFRGKHYRYHVYFPRHSNTIGKMGHVVAPGINADFSGSVVPKEEVIIYFSVAPRTALCRLFTQSWSAMSPPSP